MASMSFVIFFHWKVRDSMGVFGFLVENPTLVLHQCSLTIWPIIFPRA